MLFFKNKGTDIAVMAKHLKNRIDAAEGRIACDLVIRNAEYLNIFTCEWSNGEIAIADGAIVALEPGLHGRRYFDAKGKTIVPGFIDAHVHVESSLMTPRHFEEAILPHGTTSAVCDPHELANVAGIKGISYFLNSADKLTMDLWVMLSSCVPATDMETNGGGIIKAADLLPFITHPRQLGLAEMMNYPGVLSAQEDVTEKLAAFQQMPIDGHSPLVRGSALSAYASSGISTCHESSTADEAKEKLQKGISIWIREGSVAKDLQSLAPILTLATSTNIGFCTDDRNPVDIAREGHIDHIVRSAIRFGVPMEIAYRCASWTPARHYGLDRGFNRVGAIAPGYSADLVILDNAQTCAISSVLKRGVWISELDRSRSDLLQESVSGLRNTVRVRIPEAHELEGPKGRVNVIGAVENKIITQKLVLNHDSCGVAKLSVLERYGNGHPPANAYVSGFGDSLHGAISSSVGHDSHNLIVVGDKTTDMRVALAAIAEMGGGFAVVQNGYVLAKLALPFGGLMSDQAQARVRSELQRLREASQSIGCPLGEPFLQLAFLSLPVIPSLKLTDKGLVDVDRFQIVPVSV
ncbi:MAG: adenine deaminase [Bdellovibrionota bacterium]